MRILHISDLHISASNEAGCKLLVNAMLKDAEAHALEIPFDIAVFSGDLAGYGKSADYDLARAVLLDPVGERLDLPREHVFIAPGNHDVDRDQIRRMVELGLAESLTSEERVDQLLDDEAELPEATARIAEWRSFVSAAGFGGAERSADSLTAVAQIKLEDTLVGIAVLNSAWRCAGESDKGNLLVGAKRAEAALRAVRDCDVRLAVVHHPLDWIQPFESDRMRTEFESQGFIVLSGHEHASDPSARKSPRGEAIYLQAGCLYSHVRYPNAYLIIDIDVKDRKALVKIRRWSDKTRRFDAGTEDAPGGEQPFILPAGGDFTDRGHPRFSTVKRMIAEAAAELRVLPDDLSDANSPHPSIEDILVEPRFLSIPYKDAQAMATLTEGVGRHEIDPSEELVGKDVVVLVGDPQSGVSSSLFWLLSNGYDINATKMPAYMQLASSKLGTSRQSVTLAKAAANFGYRREDGSDPDLLLAVDDVDPELRKKFERLVTFIKHESRHRFMLGCTSSEAAKVSAALDDAGIAHTTAYLAPFGKSQLRLLATTVSRGTDADLDQIYGLIRTQSLPQTPFTMLALITVMTEPLTDPDDLNQSSLLEAFVNLLLGSGEFAEAERLGMNYRKRIALLGELARALYDCPGWSIPITDAEALFLRFFEDRALRISAGLVLQNLIARQVLASDGEYVGFRQPALLNLFLGKWMLENENNKAELLKDPIKHAEAIGHAAALRRSDRDLLEQIGLFANEAISAVAERLPRSAVDDILERFDVGDPWGEESFDKTLAALPEKRRTSKELDEELDRWSEALDLGQEALERPALSTAKELEKATLLLSDVLRHSDLVNDPALKKRLFELATEGWIVLIGLATAEDHIGGPMREMMEKVLEKVLDEDPDDESSESDIGSEDEHEIEEALDAFILLVMTIVSAAVAQARLGAKSLVSTIEACLDDDGFSESATASWLAVWIESNLDLPEWPGRLGALLDRLPRGTFLRNAAVSITIERYRSISDDKSAEAILDMLAPRLVSESDPKPVNAAIADVKERLRKSRRVYQGGLSLGSADYAGTLVSGDG